MSDRVSRITETLTSMPPKPDPAVQKKQRPQHRPISPIHDDVAVDSQSNHSRKKGVGVSCGVGGDPDDEMIRPPYLGALDMDKLTNNAGYRD